MHPSRAHFYPADRFRWWTTEFRDSEHHEASYSALREEDDPRIKDNLHMMWWVCTYRRECPT